MGLVTNRDKFKFFLRFTHWFKQLEWPVTFVSGKANRRPYFWNLQNLILSNAGIAVTRHPSYFWNNGLSHGGKHILPHSAPTDQLNLDQLSLSWWVGATSGIKITYQSVCPSARPSVRMQIFESRIGALYSLPNNWDTLYLLWSFLWIQHSV